MLNLKFISGADFLAEEEVSQREFLKLCNHTEMLYLENGTVKFGEFVADSGHTPLLTEGQLRDFIESKVGKVEILPISIGGAEGTQRYTLRSVEENVDSDYEDNTVYAVYANSLLEAYWQIATAIILRENYKSKKAQ